MKEIWKDVVGYEGMYQVSNAGNIKTLHLNKERIPATDRDGYKHLALHENGNTKNFFVHRLVAEAFIPNPNNYPIINHKDENRRNNHADNLEWCTHAYNLHYGTCIETITRLAIENQGRPVIQRNLGGEFIARHRSISEASRASGAWTSEIGKCCLGKAKTANKYRWEYA